MLHLNIDNLDARLCVLCNGCQENPVKMSNILLKVGVLHYVLVFLY